MMPVEIELSAFNKGFVFPSMLIFFFFSWSYWKNLAGMGGCKEKERGLLFKWDPVSSIKSEESHSGCIQHCKEK